ncbi:MAG: hypothetical protein JXA67_00865 [Micromonosporaceae bacterium]|nr:hypothetical protein [Micromonosporaceae bacterium]
MPDSSFPDDSDPTAAVPLPYPLAEIPACPGTPGQDWDEDQFDRSEGTDPCRWDTWEHPIPGHSIEDTIEVSVHKHHDGQPPFWSGRMPLWLGRMPFWSGRMPLWLRRTPPRRMVVGLCASTVITVIFGLAVGVTAWSGDAAPDVYDGMPSSGPDGVPGTALTASAAAASEEAPAGPAPSAGTSGTSPAGAAGGSPAPAPAASATSTKPGGGSGHPNPPMSATAPSAPSASATGPGPTFGAVAGEGCPLTETSGYQRVVTSTGWRTRSSGGWAGDGCSGQMIAVPMSGDPTRDNNDDLILWWFQPGAFATGTCAVSVYIPDTGDPRDSAGAPAHYQAYASTSSSGTPIGEFDIDQTAHRGEWVLAATLPLSGGRLAVRMVTRGQGQGAGEEQGTAGSSGEQRLGASALRVACQAHEAS